MNCEKCHFKTEVTDSRTSDLRVRRYRRCLACNHKFRTTEMTHKGWLDYLTVALQKVLKVKTDEPNNN